MKLRVARHTDKLEELKQFYVNIIGLEITGQFTNHDGYDGVFLSKREMNWELEFTCSAVSPIHNFDEDDLLVCYPENMDAYKNILTRIEKLNIKIHQPKNPYWQENGILIKDPDGFGIVICKTK